MKENAAAKARRYLTEGRIIVTHVHSDITRARVRGDGAIYAVDIHGDTETCTCEAHTRHCAHLQAVRLITAPRTPR